MNAIYRKFWYLPVLFCLVLAAALFVSHPVSADDGQPVDPPAGGEVASPPQTEPSTPVDVPAAVVDPVTTDVPAPMEGAVPVDEPAMVVEPAPVEETVPAVEFPVEPEAETNSVQDVVVALAESGVVLADPSGELLPLATRASADGILKGDPYFTVGSVTYQFTLADCDPDLADDQPCSNPITKALEYMVSHSLTPTDRKLYIQPDTYAEDVLVDGTLNGVKGLLAIVGNGTNPEDVQINGSITVQNMLSGFSISNLSVTNTVGPDQAAILFKNNKGAIKLSDVNAKSTGVDGIGIVVISQTGNVELNRVKANDNAYQGAHVDVSSPGSSVIITNSEFNHNSFNTSDGWTLFDSWVDSGNVTHQVAKRQGLSLSTWPNAITLNGVEAIDNSWHGATLWAGASPITISNSVFDNNGGDGLDLVGGAVVMTNVQASNNHYRGINAPVYISFTGSNLVLDWNGYRGLSVDACQDFYSDRNCHTLGAGTVTLSTSSAYQNGDIGFYIRAKGAITIKDGWSGYNVGDAYDLDKDYVSAVAPITITNTSAVNSAYGIVIHSRGAVPMTLTNITANDNTNKGIYIVANGTSAVTLTNTGTTLNEVARNLSNGIDIATQGPVTIINTSSNENVGFGAKIDNFTGATTPAAVTIKNVALPGSGVSNTFDNNRAGGLLIHSLGGVVLSSTIASNNQGNGMVIDNIPAGVLAGAPVTLTDLVVTGNTDGNDLTIENGISINSKGSITLMNISADGNDGWGASLVNNSVPGSKAGVTINAGTNMGNDFLGNDGDGLYIRSNGAVLLTNVIANENTAGLGVDIDNSTGTAGVTIKETGTWGTSFDYNNSYTWGNSYSRNSDGGLSVVSSGPVTITFNEASENQGGVGIYVNALGGKGAVIINGNANFIGNRAYADSNPEGGIVVKSNGAITLTKIEANRNSIEWGAFLDNSNGTGAVTLTEAWFDRNAKGLWVNTKGAVIWNVGSAMGNFTRGANIINKFDGVAGQPVTITSVDTSNNGQTGLYVDSKGVVKITDINSNCNSAMAYTISDGERWVDSLIGGQTWYFDGVIGEKVNIEVNSTNFTPNILVFDPEGIQILWEEGVDGSLITVPLDLTKDGQYQIVLSSYEEYQFWGYDISLYKGDTEPVTWTEMESIANGIYVDNSAGTNAPVTITNPTNYWISNNSATNVYVLSSGMVTLTNMDLNDSRLGGLFIDNTTSTGTPGVILTSINYYWNGGKGAEIHTNGAVLIKSAGAPNNDSDGIFIINNGKPTNTAGVTLTDVWVNDSGETGIYVRSNGPISFNAVSSTGNSFWGADLDNSSGKGFVALTGANFDNNHNGLWVNTKGAVTWKIGSANDNFARGANIINKFDGVAGQPVIITSVETIHNGRTGLYVESKGAVTITDINSNNNSADGYTILDGMRSEDNLTAGQTWYFDGADGEKVTIQVNSTNFNPHLYIVDPEGVATPWVDGTDGSLSTTLDLTKTGSYQIFLSSWEDYQGFGYDISLYKGLVAPSSWNEIDSEANGIFVDNSAGINAPVTITNPTNYWISNNSATNVDVRSSGMVTLTKMDLNDSRQGGLYIDNTTSTGTPGVTLTGVSPYNNDQIGVEIHSNGAVVIKSAGGDTNNSFGYYIINNGSHGLVPVPNTAGVIFTDLTMTYSGDTGIYIRSNGPVTFTTVDSDHNQGSGVDLETKGAVIFSDVDARWNEQYGAKVVTIGSFTTIQPAILPIVGVINVNGFGSNVLDGLNLDVDGKITLVRTYATMNGSRLDDGTPTGTPAYGIYILGTGNVLGTSPIVMTGIFLNGNTEDGMNVITKSPIILTNIESNFNAGNGIYAETTNAITGTNLTGNYNTGDGIWLNQTAGPLLAPAVTLTTIVTQFNEEIGLHVDALGNIMLIKFNANNNHGTAGVTLTNDLGKGPITVNNTGLWKGANFNSGAGFIIVSSGVVTVTGVEALGNNLDGIVIDNHGASLPSAVTVNSCTLRVNGMDAILGGNGLSIWTTGVATINGSWSIGNHGDGISLNTTNNAFINNTGSIMNDRSGIYAIMDALKILKLTGSTWFGNLRNPVLGDKNLNVPVGIVQIF